MLAKAYIEITTFCGLNCDFCEPKKIAPHQMGLPLFEKINKELQGKTKSIAYHILGDPMTVKNLGEYLDISQKYGHSIELTSSGYHLDDFDRHILLHPSIKQINFSLSSFFANTNKTKSFEQYMNAIADFCLQSQIHPKRFVNLRLWNLGNKEYEAFNSDVENFLETKFSKIIYENQKAKIAPYTILVKDKMFSWPNPVGKIISTNGNCHAVKSQIGFLSDGRVVPCCLDAKGAMELGNISDKPLGDIILSQRAQAMLKGFKNNALIEKMCQTCGFREIKL